MGDAVAPAVRAALEDLKTLGTTEALRSGVGGCWAPARGPPPCARIGNTIPVSEQVTVPERRAEAAGWGWRGWRKRRVPA